MTSSGQDMKTLLYGSEDDQVHPSALQGGKKRLVHDSTEVPFATVDQDPHNVFSKSYTKKLSKRHVHDKVGASRLFDPEIYSTNYEQSVTQRRDSSLRNFEGSGDILTHHWEKKEASRDEATDATPEET